MGKWIHLGAFGGRTRKNLRGDSPLNVLLLHGYSPNNKGDGLLVRESVRLLRDAFGPDVEFTLAASRANEFVDFPGLVVSSHPRRLLRADGLWRAWRRRAPFDLVIAVGGGYLRAGSPAATLKMSLVHLPQLVTAAYSSTPSAYLPQSIGPYPAAMLRVVRSLLKRVDRAWVRDRRSFDDLAGVQSVVRSPDLALTEATRHRRPTEVLGNIVLSVRHLDGNLPQGVRRLATALAPFDGYVQSVGGGNDDRSAMSALEPHATLSFDDLNSGPPRIVVAMRLHAALMAINAGHYVIHLAYERKGWGAFEDLGLQEYVMNARNFDVDQAMQLVGRLSTSSDARRSYDAAVAEGWRNADEQRLQIINNLRLLVGA